LRRRHFSDYDPDTAERCERALLTLLGDIGPWRERIYLAGAALRLADHVRLARRGLR